MNGGPRGVPWPDEWEAQDAGYRGARVGRLDR
jgi:hypothetical protein